MKNIIPRLFLLVVLAMALTATANYSGAASVAIPSGPCSVPASFTQAQVDGIWDTEMPVAFVAVSMAFIIALIIFMIGAAAKSDRLRNFGIGEIYEAMVSAMFVIAFAALAALILQTIPQSGLNVVFGTPGPTYTGAQVTDPFVTATSGICTLVGNVETIYDQALNGNPGACNGACIVFLPSSLVLPCLDTALNEGGYMNIQCFLTYTMSIDFYDEVKIQPFQLVGILYLTQLYQDYVVPEQVAGAVATDALYLLWAEYYLMQYFEILGPIFITAGVIFRVVLPTRAFGGVLMAIGIGFFVIMPVILSIAFTIPPVPVSTGIPTIGGSQPGVQNLSSELDALWITITVYPALAVALTYSFITQLATLIGASASMGGRLRAGFI